MGLQVLVSDEAQSQIKDKKIDHYYASAIGMNLDPQELG